METFYCIQHYADSTLFLKTIDYSLTLGHYPVWINSIDLAMHYQEYAHARSVVVSFSSLFNRGCIAITGCRIVKVIRTLNKQEIVAVIDELMHENTNR